MPFVFIPGPQLAGLNRKLDQISEKLDLLLTQEKHMAATIQATLDNLTAQVAANTTVTGSASTLIQGFAATLAAAIAAATAAGVPPETLAAFQTLQDQITSDDAKLTAAIVANTPAAPAAGPNATSRKT